METPQRCIVHFDLDSFFVSVERLFDKSLVGIPLIVGGSSNRGVVAACSYEARKFGVHSAMPIYKAKLLCPQATIVSGNSMRYSEYSGIVTDIIRDRVPLFEKSSIDEFYVDLTGMDRFFGCYKLATELRQTIMRETGLPISFGLSENKTVSKIATGQAKPNGQLMVEYGKEKEFLAPLPVQKIPMAGEKTCQLLSRMGIHRIQQLQNTPIEHLRHLLGKAGTALWHKAQGIDTSEVLPYHERKSISTESTFDFDSTDTKNLEALMVAMTEQLTSKLRREEKLASCVAVKIRYKNFDTHTQQLAIPYTSADHELLPHIKELFHKLYKEGESVRLIGVRLSNLIPGNYQVKLFDHSEEKIKLYQALDKVNRRFGAKTICRAVGMDMHTRSFNPFNGQEL